MVNQAKQNAFSCKDTALREAMFKFKNVKPRAREWLLKLIDQVYKGKANQVPAFRRLYAAARLRPRPTR